MHGLFGYGALAGTLLWGLDGGILAALAVGIPYILTFYFVLALLEDSGYMNAAAFLADRVMHLFGLHGRAVIPLMAAAGCNVPAIMGTRVLATKRERTIACALIVLVPCSARTAVILGSVSLFVGWQWALFVFGVLGLVGLAAGLLLNRILPGEPEGLVMEMFPFRRPSLRLVAVKTWKRFGTFLWAAAPIMLIGSFALGALYETGLDLASRVARSTPVVVGWLGLPAVAGLTLLLAVLRKELALQMLVVFAVARYGAGGAQPAQLHDAAPDRRLRPGGGHLHPLHRDDRHARPRAGLAPGRGDQRRHRGRRARGRRRRRAPAAPGVAQIRCSTAHVAAGRASSTAAVIGGPRRTDRPASREGRHEKSTLQLVVAAVITVAFVLTALSGLVLYTPGRLLPVFGLTLLEWRTVHLWSALVLTAAVVTHVVAQPPPRRPSARAPGSARRLAPGPAPARSPSSHRPCRSAPRRAGRRALAGRRPRLRLSRRWFLLLPAGAVAAVIAALGLERAARVTAGGGSAAAGRRPARRLSRARHRGRSAGDDRRRLGGRGRRPRRRQPLQLDLTAWLALPRTQETRTFHCVEGWSVDHVGWEGVRVADLLRRPTPQAGAGSSPSTPTAAPTPTAPSRRGARAGDPAGRPARRRAAAARPRRAAAPGHPLAARLQECQMGGAPRAHRGSGARLLGRPRLPGRGAGGLTAAAARRRAPAPPRRPTVVAGGGAQALLMPRMSSATAVLAVAVEHAHVVFEEERVLDAGEPGAAPRLITTTLPARPTSRIGMP